MHAGSPGTLCQVSSLLNSDLIQITMTNLYMTDFHISILLIHARGGPTWPSVLADGFLRQHSGRLLLPLSSPVQQISISSKTNVGNCAHL